MPRLIFEDKRKVESDGSYEKIVLEGWGLAAFVFAIASLFCCCFQFFGVPMGIPLGIFGIAFAFIDKGNKKFHRFHIASIVICIVGIIIGFLLYAMILYVVEKLQDPAVANALNEKISQMPEAIRQIYGY